MSPCGGPGTLEERWAKPRDEGWSAERLGPHSLAGRSLGWDRQSSGTGGTQAVPRETSASAPVDEDTGNGSDLASRLCPLPFEYSVGFPVFQRKPVPHTALRTFGAHTTSNPNPPQFTPDPWESPAPCSQACGLRAHHLRVRGLQADGAGAASSGLTAEATTPGPRGSHPQPCSPDLQTHSYECTHPCARTNMGYTALCTHTGAHTQVHTGTAHGAPPPQLGASPAPGTATLTPQMLSNVCVQLARCQGSQLVGTGNPPTSFPP